MKTIVEELTHDTISLIYKEIKKPKSRQRVEEIINTVTSMAFDRFKPYLITTMAILIILFLLNCFQFYYYIRLKIIGGHSQLS
jgi:hypothetical protein